MQSLHPKLPAIADDSYGKLAAYTELLLKWNRKINLIGRATEAQVWQRHILDSAQLLQYLPDRFNTLVDLGSGAGFPGLVLAILGAGERVVLIESNAKKCAFLREAARVTGCNHVEILHERIETVAPFAADIVTARALAPVDKLLNLAEPFLDNHSICLFLKGKAAEEEVREARAFWQVTEAQYPSMVIPPETSDQGWVLELTEIRKR